ncbi:hypothetical protein I7I53_10364 [Histoplasma capsulatum var. duboisii H88]|uniref:Uncharacterized protein n=1 Tax=Ajellomyces capsulatus (strain H88) TaxID=544711 RepID=A0A8A1LB20_AJEC8|nr:hypothetical protein I7I53_10364 [Histoplasma capsulatum var. duboisii H88]
MYSTFLDSSSEEEILIRFSALLTCPVHVLSVIHRLLPLHPFYGLLSETRITVPPICLTCLLWVFPNIRLWEPACCFHPLVCEMLSIAQPKPYLIPIGFDRDPCPFSCCFSNCSLSGYRFPAFAVDICLALTCSS